MNKELPCYIVSDLLPFYQEDILLEQTKEDIDKHIKECEVCKKNLETMKIQIDVKNTNIEMETTPFKKIRFYQKVLTILGGFIAFIFGACYPVARLGIGVIIRGGITAYQIERLKNLWYLLILECGFAGVIVCICYFLIILFVRKVICKKRVS